MKNWVFSICLVILALFAVIRVSKIGLSEEQVVELLGEPGYKYTDRENEENYENGIVKYAYIKDITDL